MTDFHSIGLLHKATLKATEKNDFSEYAKLLRKHPSLFVGSFASEARELICQKLEGSFKPARGRRVSREQKWEAENEAVSIYHCYLWLTKIEGWKKESARTEIAKVFRLSETTVKSRIKLIKKKPKPATVTLLIELELVHLNIISAKSRKLSGHSYSELKPYGLAGK